ncbi:MAG: ComEC/Rec2 family competence protein [Planctomycetaceae bacterium]
MFRRCMLSVNLGVMRYWGGTRAEAFVNASRAGSVRQLTCVKQARSGKLSDMWSLADGVIGHSTTAGTQPACAKPRRAPAAPVAVAVGLGILTDHLCPLALPIWIAIGLVAFAGWYVNFRMQRRWASACLLLAVFLAGAGWHHRHWSLASPDHVVRYAVARPAPIRILGRIVDRPHTIPPRPQELPVAIPQLDRTICTLDCRALVSGAIRIPVSGWTRLEVSGHPLHAGAGDDVDVVGLLSRPADVDNPGGFDYRRYLRNSQLLTVLRCNEPDDVRVELAGGSGWRRWQGALRAQAEQLMRATLSAQTAPVGQALLLGTRHDVPEEQRRAFAESGTMHVLAISGANVGILAGLLWMVAQAIGLGRSATVGVVLSGILGYAFLADSQPPVVRAVLMFVAVLAGRPWYRHATPVNALGLAALGVLLWNPTSLFDLGAQLSFLAVGALIWAPTWLPLRWIAPRRFSEPSLRLTPRWLSLLHDGGRWVLVAQGTLAAIWLFTLPLTIARFHLISPVGFVVNVVLAPVIVAVLWSGYAALIVGLLAPATAGLFAGVYDVGLSLMLWIIEKSAGTAGGHFYLAGPGEGWLIGYYVCLLAVVWGFPGSRWRWWGFRALGVWMVCGLGLALWPSAPRELRCTFLSVGHGLAVVVETPGGRTLVYDAGQMQDGARAADIVQQALWAEHNDRVDALVVSHADIDHFNGVPGLVRTARVQTAFAHPSLLDFEQQAVRGLCDAISRERVPLRLVWAGDRLQIEDGVIIRVLHPAAGPGATIDNANSLVLEIEYAGRRILLTGDLEQQGLKRLLELPPRHVDVLLAPHHGSLNANTSELAHWATPTHVVVSGDRNDPYERLRPVYGHGTTVLSTAMQGAVTCVISPEGGLKCKPFR